MSCNNYNDDEAFARMLQEEENRQYESYKADCELKKKIQEGSIIDLCSDDEELPFKEELNSYENNNEMTSFLYALQLQQQEEDLQLAIDKTAVDKVDESILEEELPNIHSLFVYFNKTYFDNQLSMVEVKWSTKMTRWYYIYCTLLSLFHVLTLY